MEEDVFATAECRVCGERVSLLLAPLHIEDHQQRGEYPAPSRVPSTSEGEGV